MEKTEGTAKFAVVAAICFGTYLLCYSAAAIKEQIVLVRYVGADQWAHLSHAGLIGSVVLAVTLTGFTVMLLIRNRIGMACAAAPYLLFLIYRGSAQFYVWGLFTLLAYTALIVLLILSMKKVRAVKFLWFMPAAIYCQACGAPLIGWR